MLSKLNKAMKETQKSILIARDFGIIQGILNFCDAVIFRSKGTIGKKCAKKVQYHAATCIKKKYGYILNSFEDTEDEVISRECPIWIFWWQGLKNAPLIVQDCIRSIYKYRGKHIVVIIDKYNYKKYTQIPDYIIEKVEHGYITLTQFSDILRIDLLFQNGGIWMDSTLLAVGEFTSTINNSLYTIHHGCNAEYHICRGLWSGFFLASGKNNSVMKLIRDIFFEYWKNERTLITYFLIDCIIAICYEEIPAFKRIINDIPLNNQNVFSLMPILGEVYDSDYWNELTRNTKLFKLSYKNKLDTFHPSSYYNVIINQNV